MKKLFVSGLMILILSASCVYASPQDSEPDKKALREQRREDRRQQKELRKQERKQKREATTEQSTPQQENSNNAEFIIPPAKPSPQKPATVPQPILTLKQTIKSQITQERNEIKTTQAPTPQSVQSSEKQISTGERSSSNSGWSGIITFILVCSGIVWILSLIFSGKCRGCGKYRAMEEINRSHLGTVKSELVKDSNGHSHRVYSNRIQINRQCQYCGYKDRIIKTIKGDEE